MRVPVARREKLTVRYTIRRVRIRSLLKYGFVVGAVIAVLPGIVCGVASSAGIRALRAWLESWDAIQINLVVTTLEFNLVEVLHLDQVMSRLQSLDQWGVWLVLLLALGTTLLAGLAAALISGLAGLAYNGIARLSGGIQVEAESEAGPAGLRAVPAAAERPAPPQPSPAGRRPSTALLPAKAPTAWLGLASDSSQRWPLGLPANRIGSQPGCEVSMPYPGVAGIHAEIRLEQGRFILYDLGQGQIWVNQRPIAGKHLLRDGFLLRIGPVDLVFRQQ